MRGIRIFILLVLAWSIGAVTTQAQSQKLDNPFVSQRFDFWDRAVALFAQVNQLPDENPSKSTLAALFSSIDTARALMINGGNPLAVRIDQFNARVEAHALDSAAYDKDAAAYRTELEAYNADSNAYKAAGGGSTMPADDPRLPGLQAWKARLDVWFARVDSWFKRIEAWRARFNTEAYAITDAREALKGDIAKFLTDWQGTCNIFIESADRTLKVADIDAKLVVLRRKLASDKRELEQYRDRLPGLHADIEKMAEQAEESRQETQLAALDKMIGLALDGLVHQVSAREVVAKAKLDKIKAILAKHGVSAKDVGLVLENHAGSKLPHTKLLLEQLGQLRDVASAYEATTKQEYLKALASCLNVFVQTPILKLVVTNVELYTNLLYTGLSYATAKARVTQYGKLSEAQLAAVAKISDLYRKHLAEQSKLVKERKEISGED